MSIRSVQRVIRIWHLVGIAERRVKRIRTHMAFKFPYQLLHISMGVWLPLPVCAAVGTRLARKLADASNGEAFVFA